MAGLGVAGPATAAGGRVVAGAGVFARQRLTVDRQVRLRYGLSIDQRRGGSLTLWTAVFAVRRGVCRCAHRWLGGLLFFWALALGQVVRGLQFFVFSFGTLGQVVRGLQFFVFSF